MKSLITGMILTVGLMIGSVSSAEEIQISDMNIQQEASSNTNTVQSIDEEEAARPFHHTGALAGEP